MPIGPLNPPPMRSPFIDKSGRDADVNTGISRAWYLWLKNTFETIIALVTSVSGSTIINATQSELSGLAALLGPGDTGQLVYVTDYNHTLRWTGTGFAWGPGENGSGYISAFLNDPSPTTGWQVCDGTLTSKLNSDGTISAVTVPNYATASYLKLGSAAPVAGPTAASGVTGATSAGTPTGTNSNPNTGNDTDAGFLAMADPAGTLVALNPHVHTTVAPVFTGNAMATHTHAPGTVELQRTQLKAWYRR